MIQRIHIISSRAILLFAILWKLLGMHTTMQAGNIIYLGTTVCPIQSGTQTVYANWREITAVDSLSSLNYYVSVQGLNYIVSCTPLEAVKDIGELSKIEQQRASSVTYCDGLGRPVQTVLPLHTPAGKDLVSHTEYDASGRESKKIFTLC